MKVVLQNVTKKFPARGKKGQADVVAVDDFSFEIPDKGVVSPVTVWVHSQFSL